MRGINNIKGKKTTVTRTQRAVAPGGWLVDREVVPNNDNTHTLVSWKGYQKGSILAGYIANADLIPTKPDVN